MDHSDAGRSRLLITVSSDLQAHQIRCWVNREPPEAVLSDIVAEIKRYATPPARRWRRRTWRLWVWFVCTVGGGLITWLITTYVLLPLLMRGSSLREMTDRQAGVGRAAV